MKVNDVIYGEEEIEEQVLIDLINSKSIQRLKGISQYMPKEYFHKKEFSRYDHSLGVMILLRRLSAKLNEQIAGLIHDVSHTAFSHVTELIFGDPRKDDHQDKNHKKFIENSDIPKILSKHGLDYNNFLDLKKYTLLEREIPNLCADRVDYALRQIFIEEGKEKSNDCVKGLINVEGKIVFNSYDVAKFFALCFLKYQVYIWGSDEGKIRFKILAEILNHALKKGIISSKDLWKDDEYVLLILRNVDDEEITSRFKLLERNNVSDLENYKENLPKKFRHVDPLVLIEDDFFKLSEISEDYKKLLNLEKEKSMKLNFSKTTT
tara:strand:+ start:4535 stop:5497 length:963 start_codon:yes stop_codon:yes gene_type:complete